MKHFSLKRYLPAAKLGLVVMGVQLMMSLFAMALTGLSNIHVVWQLLLSALFLVGVIVIVFAYTKNVAYDEFNRKMNNRARLKNGEQLDDTMKGKEYVWYKGYLIGAGICLPLIIFTIILFCMQSTGVRIATLALYGCYLFPIVLPVGTFHPALSFLVMAIVVMLVGVTYHVQGIKMETGLESKVDSRVKGKLTDIGVEPKKKKRR